ncbi:hypothetical protein BGK46_13860 [Salinivibrio sp. SS2]|nr:hypothetical protein BGK46_13860 [Salinivibrio sp. DV]
MVTASAFGFKVWPWRHWADCAPDSLAIESDTSLTWQALVADVDRQQTQFNAAPVVVFDSRLAPQRLVVGLLAAWQAGKITLVLNHALSDDVKAAVLAELGEFQWLDRAQNEARGADAISIASWQPRQPLTMTLTSGSTGKPKAVVHAAHQHLASAAGLTQMLPYQGLSEYEERPSSSTDSWLLSLPLFHVSGLAIVWRWLFKGATLSIFPCQGEALPESLTRVTHASLVPTQLYRALPWLAARQAPSRLKHVLLGGAVIPARLTQLAEQQGIACWCGYGMTETASTVTLKRADGHDDVGEPLPYRAVALASDGEVIHRGDTLALGYWQAGRLKALSAEQGLGSRDLARWETRRQRSVLRIIGRKDNQFICGGENVQPERIENHLLQRDEISQVVVVPVIDHEFGARPVAIVQSTAQLDQAQLTAHCHSLAPYQRPIAFLPWPILEQGASIKPSRLQLAQWASQQIEH